MNARMNRFRGTPWSRIGLGLALALTLLTAVTGSATPVRAAPTVRRDPAYRIQVVIKTVEIYDDRDLFGSGDFSMRSTLHRCPDPPTDDCATSVLEGIQTNHMASFSGDTGETVQLNLTLPRTGDPVWGGYDLSENAGYPVYEGERYVLRIELWDEDPAGQEDYMGFVNVPLAPENQYYLGSHHDIAMKGGLGTSGDFGLDYEVMVTQLPNLAPIGLEIYPLPNAVQDICVRLANTGPEAAGPFKVALYADTELVHDSLVDVDGFAAGQIDLICTKTDPWLGPGNHHLVAIVDSTQVVPEMNEHDNRFETDVTLPPSGPPRGPDTNPAPSTGSAAPATPTPAPKAALPDLTVSAIKVNGQVPDGKDDCKDGQNDITVVVKNGGAEKAGGFAVQLNVDGASRAETVGGLEAGQEREVRFDNVRLKKGDHTVIATVDRKEDAKTDEGHNTLQVTARCSDDN